MKKQLATLALAIVVGALGFVVAGVAVASNGKPPSPPGQGPCEHGNSAQPCKEDPQTDKGKDCEEHGNQGGVNEDHCKGEDQTTTETTTTETTTTETTPSETTPSETTPSETTTPSQTTPSATTPSETTPSETTTPAPPTIVGKPPVAAKAKTKAAVAGFTGNAPKPTHQPQEAPFTL